jgi:hypothetical protein
MQNREEKIPYVVAGARGYANTPWRLHKIELNSNGQRLVARYQTAREDLILMAHTLGGPLGTYSNFYTARRKE